MQNNVFAPMSLVLPLVYWKLDLVFKLFRSCRKITFIAEGELFPRLILASFKENTLVIHHLRSQNPLQVGNIALTIGFQHRSSLCFLISHPLLCNLFSQYLPGTGTAGYNFDFAFPRSRAQLGNAEMFP